MAQNFTPLDQEVGNQSIDQDFAAEMPLINNLYVGQFRRGRLDKPMTITLENIREALGHDIKNRDYVAVRDILDQGVRSIQVLRISIGFIDDDQTGILQEQSDFFIETEDGQILQEEIPT